MSNAYRLYIPNNQNQITTWDSATGFVGSPLSVGSSGAAYVKKPAVSPDGTLLYVPHYQDQMLYVVDISSGTVLHSISIPETPIGCWVRPDGAQVWIQGSANDFVVSTSSWSVVATVNPGFNNPQNIAFSPDSTKAYCADNYYGGRVWVINTTTFATIAESTPSGRTTVSVAASADGTKVYAGNYYANAGANVIDTSTWNEDTGVGSPWLNGGSGSGEPNGALIVALVVSNDGTKLYALDYANAALYVLNTANGAILATVTVGSSPIGLTLSPDGSLLAVACYGNVAVVNTATNTVAETLSSGLSEIQGATFSTVDSDATYNYVPGQYWPV